MLLANFLKLWSAFWRRPRQSSAIFLVMVALCGAKFSAQNADSRAANDPLSSVQANRNSLDPIGICAQTNEENSERVSTVRKENLDFTVILTSENESCSIYNRSILETKFKCDEKETFNCIKGALESLYGAKITDGKLLIPEGQTRDGGDGNLKIIFNYRGQISGGRNAESSQAASCHFVADGLAWLSLSSAQLYLRETINISECVENN